MLCTCLYIIGASHHFNMMKWCDSPSRYLLVNYITSIKLAMDLWLYRGNVTEICSMNSYSWIVSLRGQDGMFMWCDVSLLASICYMIHMVVRIAPLLDDDVVCSPLHSYTK